MNKIIGPHPAQASRGGLHSLSATIGLRLLRGYTLRSPFQRGKWRIEKLVHRMARALPPGTTVVLSSKDGRRFQIDPADLQFYMGFLSRGEFEPQSSRLLSKLAAKGDVVVDAGANFGWYTTLLSSEVGEHGAVHAFEPASRTAAALHRNCQLNRCQNVVIVQKALGSVTGGSALYQPLAGASGDATLFPVEGQRSAAEKVDMVRLDDYRRAQDLQRCDLLKLDVEGSELSALQGARELLSEFRPTILFESNPGTAKNAGYSPEAVLDEIQRYEGYHFFCVEGDTDFGTGPEPRTGTLPLTQHMNILAVSDSRPRVLDKVRGIPWVTTLHLTPNRRGASPLEKPPPASS